MRYRKLPVEIEAVRWMGDNLLEVLEFTNATSYWVHSNFGGDENGALMVKTLEGDMKASKGDYIIKGISGEFYPCKPDIFKKTYEEVDDGPCGAIPFKSLSKEMQETLVDIEDKLER